MLKTTLGPLSATLKGTFDCNNTFNFPNVSLWVDLTWTLDHPPAAGRGLYPATVTGTITNGVSEYLTSNSGYFLFEKYGD